MATRSHSPGTELALSNHMGSTSVQSARSPIGYHSFWRLSRYAASLEWLRLDRLGEVGDLLRVSLRDLRAHLGRYALSFVAVALGVAFMAGVTTLTDTITRTFDSVYAHAYDGSDAWVRAKAEFEVGARFGGAEQRPRMDESVIEQIRGMNGVAAAEPYVEDFAQLIGKNGEPYGTGSLDPTMYGASWSEVEELNQFQLVEGSRAPLGPGEVVLDKATAEDMGHEIGDTIKLQTGDGVHEATLVGVARFGSADAKPGDSFAMFDLDTAQALFAEPDRVDAIGLVAADGISQAELRDQVAAALGQDNLEVLTAKAITDENQTVSSQQFNFVRTFLLVFAGITVAASTFVIYTSYSFILARRQRQLALLRALGASRGQVLRALLAEAIVVGGVACAVGYLSGVGLAGLLSRLVTPDGTLLVIRPGSVVLALAVGTTVTMLSALLPAWRASNVPPVAAMTLHEVDRSQRSMRRLACGILALAAGVVPFVQGLSRSDVTTAGVGIGLLFLALVILGPAASHPAVATLGAPLRAGRGIVGRIAQRNAQRSPQRTASTASTLMLGIGIVTLLVVVNASMRASIDAVADRFSGDVIIDSGTSQPGEGLPSSVASEINQLPEVDSSTGIRFGLAEVEQTGQPVTGIDPGRALDLYNFPLAGGSLRDLDHTSIAVPQSKADDNGWRLGDTLDVRFSETGNQQFTIRALLETSDLTGSVLLNAAAFDTNMDQTADAHILVRLADGVSLDEARSGLQRVIEQFPSAQIQDLGAFKAETKSQLDPILVLLNVLVAFTILIAVIATVNTLILSILERSREIALTRAVGASRRQIRSSIRWETLLITAFGLLGALGAGVLSGWAIVQALSEQGFTDFKVPYRQLALLTTLTTVASLLASATPARWASRRDILTAISAEHQPG